VADLLFRQGAACQLYRRPRNTYDFKNKVLSAIKARYDRVNGPGTHSSSNNPNDHEDLLEVDKLSVHLYVEYQEAVDIQEALQPNNLLEKENIQNASNFLAPNPQPLPRSSDVTQNPLSAISNEAPTLVNDDVPPKPTIGTKKQRLTSYDTNEVMVSFATSNQQSEVAFQDYMRSRIKWEKEKAAIEKRRFLMFLIEKKASGAISNEEFELFKNT
jgi:preprotein translocase subunit SecD